MMLHGFGLFKLVGMFLATQAACQILIPWPVKNPGGDSENSRSLPLDHEGILPMMFHFIMSRIIEKYFF